MFEPSLIYHHASQSSRDILVPKNFGLLCWNVHKNNATHPDFKSYLHNIIIEENIDFVLLQEASFRDNKHCMLSEFSFDAAANLEVKGKFYGVLTASKVNSQKAEAYLSEGKESFIRTHKSLLVSMYPFEDRTMLLVFNVHAINFRETKRYSKELERFVALAKDHKGPIIIAGDFNTWNKKRMQKLDEIKERLSLKAVPFNQADKVKSFMGNHLDFILYRDLELLGHNVHKNHKLSDHNPLCVKFKQIG